MCRDMAIDGEGNVYLPLAYKGSGPLPPSAWFANAYQPTVAGGADVGVMKVHYSGGLVLWATWLGGSGKEGNECGIRLDGDGNVYLNFTTWSANMPTTDGAYDRTHNGGSDAFVAKLSPDGSQLLYGTYFGRSGNDWGISTHNLAVDTEGNAYLVVSTQDGGFPTTPRVVQPSRAGASDLIIAKFSPSGALLLCTYLGGGGDEGPDGVYADDEGNVFFTGQTDSADFPITVDTAFQTVLSTPKDAMLAVLSADFGSLAYSTLMGGTAYDDGRSGFLDAQCNLYITGSTNGTGWPTRNAYQSTFAGGGGGQELCYKGGCYAGDVILAKFALDFNGLSCPSFPSADINKDCVVDFHDFAILASEWMLSNLEPISQ
jgi:hypothetical protein